MATKKVKSDRPKRQATTKDNTELGILLESAKRYIILARRSSRSLGRARDRGDDAAVKTYHAQVLTRLREFDKCSAKITKILKK